MTEAEFLDAVARDQAARAMLAALEKIVASEHGIYWRTDQQARDAIATAKAAGIKAEG